MLLTYDVRNLKRRFPELNRFRDEILAPLLAGCISRFVEDLLSDGSKYGVRNLRIVRRFDGQTNLSDLLRLQIAAEVIWIRIYYLNIYIVNGEGALHVGYRITFDSGGAKDVSVQTLLYDAFRNSVETQELSDLKREVVEDLMASRKIDHLIPGIPQFYLNLKYK